LTEWDRLRRQLDGSLVEVRFPFHERDRDDDLFARLEDPYFIADHVGLTQTCGWVDAWTCTPSAMAVVPKTTMDVAAAVRFARRHHVRLVVKGGGHSYTGGSCAPGSLLVWMKDMREVDLQPTFVPRGCEGRVAPRPAVSVGAGATWLSVYHEVTARGGRYVQGAGALTVGVAGLVQSGGFGSFSKRYGLAAGGLLEAEVVTADGAVRVVNEALDQDLFWALKGGGGGSFAVVTRVTLLTHELPTFFGTVSGRITACSDATFRQLVHAVITFYATRLFNPQWGEQIVLGADNTVELKMMFQGLDRSAVEELWRPFLELVKGASPDWTLSGWMITCTPASRFWSPGSHPDLVTRGAASDDRAAHLLMAGDERRVGQFIHGYRSRWLPATLLVAEHREALVDALFAATRHWEVCLHVNKGLAGADPEAIASARATPMNPAVLDAFALARCSAEEGPAFPGCAGHEPDVELARRQAREVGAAMDELSQLSPDGGSYVAESDFFEADWPRSFWGANDARLLAVKRRYDPTGFFFVHHGIGSAASNDP
jgi:FAD/FMN-containing dehydrogenase